MGLIKVECKDKVILEVDDIILNASKVLSDMEALGEGGKNQKIRISNVESAILKKVVEWATHHHKHKDDPPEQEMEVEGDGEEKEKKETTKKKGDDEAKISPWDAEFLKVDQATLFAIILAANFLDIKDLLEMACNVVSNMIRGKTGVEIRKTFNIPNNKFTKEEEELIKNQNAWCEEK